MIYKNGNLVTENIKVSIIVPVYNVEKYLPTCLDTLINQTLKDIEIICVNDETPDNSLEILEEYASKDNRVKVFSKKNGGLSDARNWGIERAKGEYIGFVDSDDFVELDMFEKLYNKARKSDSDMAMCQIALYDDQSHETIVDKWYYALKCFDGFDKDSFSPEETKDFSENIAVTAWNKIYKREFLLKNDYKFPKGLIFEDEAFFYDVYFNAENISILREALYNYRINTGSSIISTSDKDFSDIIRVFKLIRRSLITNNHISDYKNQVYNRFFHLALMRYSQTSDIYKENYWNLMSQDFKKLVKFDKKENSQENQEDYKIYFEDILDYLQDRIYNLLTSENFEEFKSRDSIKKFSVIMPFYNNEKYLDSSINSIFEQSIRFMHYVELILVDDGSTDNSREIALKYQQEYPYNVTLLTQEHKGQSAARNYGLQYANGEYVTFVDSDDYITYYTLEQVYNFFKEHEDEIDVVSIPIQYFEDKAGTYEYNSDFNHNILDLNINPLNPQLNVVSNFIKRDVAVNTKFMEDLTLSEDMLYINEILNNKKKIGLVDSVKYFYRIREDNTSILQNKYSNKDYYNKVEKYYNFLMEKFINKNLEIPKFIQTSIAINIKKLLDVSTIDILDESEIKNLIKYLKLVLGLLDNSIFDELHFGSNKKNFIKYISNNHTIEKIDNNIVLKCGNETFDILDTHTVYLNDFEIEDDNLFITGFLYSYFENDYIDINFIKKSNGKTVIVPCEYIENQEYQNSLNILSQKWLYSYNFKVSVPVSSLENMTTGFEVNYDDNNLKTTFYPTISFRNKHPMLNSNIYVENNIIKLDKVKYSNRAFKISIIMPIYNTEKYLEEAIESVIKQNIGFERNVQLILIDDGSTDNSLKIAYEYHKQYPNNIFLISQHHQGQSVARNRGLGYATGEYVNFLDSDDYLSKNTLKEVYNYFEKNKGQIDLVSIPIKTIDRENNTYDYGSREVIDLEEKSDYTLLSLSSTFIKRNTVLNSEKFDPEMNISEDSLLLNQILLSNTKIGIINKVAYHYRKRHDYSSINDELIFKEEYYTDRLNKFHLRIIEESENKYGFVPKFIQNNLLTDIQKYFEIENFNIYQNESELETFWNTLSKVLEKIDDNEISSNENVKEVSFNKFVKNGRELNVSEENGKIILKTDETIIDTLDVHPIYLEDIRLGDNKLHLTIKYISHFKSENITIDGIIKKNDEQFIIPSKRIHSHKNEFFKIMSNTWKYSNKFYLDVPLDDCKLTQLQFKVNFENNNINSSYMTRIKQTGNASSQLNKLDDPGFSVEISDDTCNIKRKFKVSVVMAIYNTEEYLRQSIDSVINQSIGFKDSIQLILVDDGSTDSSYNISSEYKEQYPNNVVLLTQENQGQAAARNNGLKYAEGKYANFLDSDDYLAEDAIEKVYEFFEENEKDIDIVAIPQVYFGRQEGDHILNPKFDETRVIDLIEEPCNPQLASNSAFFKRTLFEEYEFPTNVIFSEDAIMVNKILLRKKKLGVVSDTYYYYQKRTDLSSTIDIVTQQKEYYTDKLKYYFLELINYSILKENKVLEFIQYTLSYDIQWMLNEDLSLLTQQNEIDEFWYYMDQVVKHFDDKVIKTNRYINNYHRKMYLLYLKYKKVTKEVEIDTVKLKINYTYIDNLKDHKLWIDLLEIKDNFLNISGFYNSFFNVNNISIDAIKERNSQTTVYRGRYVKYSYRDHEQYLGEDWQYHFNFDIKVPLEENEASSIKLRINYHIDGNTENNDPDNLRSVFLDLSFQAFTRISDISHYQIKDGHMIILVDNSFLIQPYSYKLMIKKEYEVLNKINEEKGEGYKNLMLLRAIYSLLYPLVRFKNRNRKTYLYMDRWNVADDNSTQLFKYAVKQKDNVNNYLVLSKQSNQYKELSRFGKILEPKSFKHKLVYLFADRIMSTQPYEFQLNPFFDEDSDKDQRKMMNGLCNAEVHFLQHGVTKDDVSSWLHKYDLNLSLLVTVNDQERQSMLNDNYNYGEDVIQTLGFPRYDLLTNEKTKKQILISPSWRNYYNDEKNLFINSPYYKSLTKLLNNKKLINLAKKYGYEIIFKPHPNLEFNIKDSPEERFIDLMEIDEEIIYSTKESYIQLFNESAIMITDYSSVFFDFAYLKKPIIYYRPDNDYHYETTYFDWETMGFGEIISDETRFLEKIEEYLKTDCKMEDEYQTRVDNFFKFNDKNNSKRVYDAIKKLDN